MLVVARSESCERCGAAVLQLIPQKSIADHQTRAGLSVHHQTWGTVFGPSERFRRGVPMFEEVNINNCQRMQTIISECFERESPKFHSQILIEGKVRRMNGQINEILYKKNLGKGQCFYCPTVILEKQNKYNPYLTIRDQPVGSKPIGGHPRPQTSEK